MNLFSALVSGFLGLYKINKDERQIRLILGMLLSFWLTLSGVWGAVGLATLKATGSPTIALTTGFLSGLLAASGAAFVRFTNDPLSKGMGITVPGAVTQAASTTLIDGGVDVRK